MRHVIEITRAGLIDLIKSVPSTRAHLYIRRERIYRNGKPAWRYFYRDDDDRKRASKTIDDEHGGDLVEHHLVADTSRLYDSHRKELPPTRDWTTERLSQQLITRPHVKLSTAFQAKFKKPAIDAEDHGLGPERNPTQRIAMALGMLPEAVQKLANITELAIFDRSDPELKKRAEETGRPVPAVYMERLEKGVRVVLVCDEGANGVNTAPHGEPFFGSALTLTEERIWHQVGRAVLEHAKKDKRLLLKLGEFRTLSKSVSSLDEKVSAFAERNWEADFAESFACLMSHPKQLAEQAPDRYEWLVKSGFGNSKLPAKADGLLEAQPSAYAWYEARKKTKTRKVLDTLKTQPPKDIPFRSEKDQFYSMSVEGRTIYFRIGPPEAAAEPGWDRMPDTVDPKTGLPAYDSRVSNAFRGLEQYKEIYDEHGNRLDAVSAFFFLQQGQADADWESKISDDTPDDPGKLRQYALNSKRDWSLARKIFNSTGENRAHTKAEREKEDRAVADYIKQGKIDEKRGSRWQWVPRPISKDEFVAKTPTFAFDGIREAKDQPFALVGQMDHDSRGREHQKLAAKVYEVQNIDGSTIRMTVQESAAFEHGQSMLAPVVIETKDAESGETSRTLEWRRVELRIASPGAAVGYDQSTNVLSVQSLEPKDIAKELKASQQELLHRNGKFRQHQLHDPILAGLINPNNRPIRNASDLMQLIREAAKIGTTKWVSILHSSDTPAHTVHAQVKFDGGGSPLLLGDYWKRKLGLENPRVADLLRPNGSLKLQKPQERTPRRPKIKVGDVVRTVVNGVEIFARLLDRVVDGKRKYTVAPLSGQESPPGWERMPETFETARILSVPSDRDPLRPNVRLREYAPLDNDILLFTDELETETVSRRVGKRMVKTTALIPGSGVVKIQPPKDGSWTFDELARVRGVSLNDKGELLLDVRFIDKFRERVGGFSMDDETQRRMRLIMEKSKAAGSIRPHKVHVQDLVDPMNGNKVRTDALLKGCRADIDDSAFTLGKHQVEALQAIADADGRQLLAHFMGCLSGETTIPVNRAGRGFSISLRELVAKHSEASTTPGHAQWDAKIPTQCMSICGDGLRLNDMLDAIYSGKKETFLLRTVSGNSIRATAEHPFWTETGWVQLGDLNPGDTVFVQKKNGLGRAKKKIYHYRGTLFNHPYAGVRGAKSNPCRVPTHRLVMEASMNNIELEEFVLRCRHGEVEGLSFLDPREYAVHHKDGDHQNNEIDNLEVLTHKEHWAKHAEAEGWTNLPYMGMVLDQVAFVGDEREEDTYDIVMHPSSQSYVANGFVVHNTGKTVTAVAAIKMMQNMKTPEGKPHPNRPKRTIVVVPPSTAAQWQSEVARFSHGRATVVGSSQTSNALQMWAPPAELQRKTNEEWEDFFSRIKMDRTQYEAKVEEMRRTAMASDRRYWRPEEDESDIVIVTQEYFTLHADELKRVGGFDGMVVDEAHGVQRENQRSNKVLEWNPDMKMMLLMTGTPITNRMNTLPRYIRVLSKGETMLGGEGSEKEQQQAFESWAMTESLVMKENGSKSAVKMDINPQAAARVSELARPWIHVATSGDVADKTMPAVLLDENNPTPQTPIQASLYRGYMGEMTDADRKHFELSANLGEDESILSDDARRKVNSARMICNTLAYKPPDGREYITVDIPDTKAYRAKVKEEKQKAVEKDRDPAEAAAKVDVDKFRKKVEFRLPELSQIQKTASGFWPSDVQLTSLYPHPEQRTAFRRWVGYALGKDYEKQLEGKSIKGSTSEAQQQAMKSGEPINGMAFGKKVANPDYGPEGAICRGVFDEATQSAKPIEYKVRDDSGNVVETIEVPVGLRFIRDPGKKSAGLYYIGGLPADHPDRAKFKSDWDFSKQVVDDALKDSAKSVKGAEKGQRPLEGHNAFNIQRHPARRKQRLMFDLAMTVGNTKTDDMERYMAAKFDPMHGGDPHKQMIIFAEAIGSGVRCVESKLRMLGYQDVNEALNSTLRGNQLVPPNGKYFVTYMGNEGTLGNRDINSEIFRKRKNADGSDSDMSMFVHRSLHGTSGKIKPGRIVEGWPADQRQIIANNFDGLEMPARVMQDKETGKFRYFYEGDLKASQKRRFNILSVEMLAGSAVEKKAAEEKMRAFLADHWTDRAPLTERQVHVFNNCQMMVASDAAQVGLNWGNATDLIMYDSLFSPMEEWQRITRAARMLPPAVRDKFKEHFAKLGAHIESMENESGLKEYDGEVNGAMSIVTDALETLPDVRQALEQSGLNPEAVAESYLAQRALDRIRQLRPQIEQKLRTEGRTLHKAPEIVTSTGETKSQYIPKHEITSADITNEILEGTDAGKPYLSEFEKSILRTRKYLVDVKRLTTSVEAPIRKTVKEKISVPSEDGKRSKVRTVKREITVGYQVEFPSKAEKSKLLQARAKQVPMEAFLADLQTEFPVHTSYDFEAVTPTQLARFDSPAVAPLTPEQMAAKELGKKESEKFYGRDKSGLTRRQREQQERRDLAKRRKIEDAAKKKVIREQRASEARQRARKRMKKSMLPLEFL